MDDCRTDHEPEGRAEGGHVGGDPVVLPVLARHDVELQLLVKLHGPETDGAEVQQHGQGVPQVEPWHARQRPDGCGGRVDDGEDARQRAEQQGAAQRADGGHPQAVEQQVLLSARQVHDVDVVGAPAVGHVELLPAVEQAEGDAALRLVGVGRADGAGRDPLARGEGGHEQPQRQARAQERDEHHAPLPQVHRGVDSGRLLETTTTTLYYPRSRTRPGGRDGAGGCCGGARLGGSGPGTPPGCCRARTTAPARRAALVTNNTLPDTHSGTRAFLAGEPW